MRRSSPDAAIGWLTALLLHAALLAALIIGQPVSLPLPPGRIVVSLLFEHPAAPAAVAPRPPNMPARPPATASAVIANTLPATTAIAQPVPRPVSPGFVAAEPLREVNQPPEYPPAAVQQGEQGRVLLSIHILPDGRADFVSVTQGSGFPILDQAAADAALKWRFQPATMAGQPVVMVIPFWINFDLATRSVRPAASAPDQ